MADELTRTATFIVDSLTADATLPGLIGGAGSERIYGELVPQGAVFPVVRFDLIFARDVRGGTLASARIMADQLFLIRGIAEAKSFETLATIADRIDAVFGLGTGGAAGDDGVVFSSIREEPFQLVENDNGVQYRHLGGMYRFTTQV